MKKILAAAAAFVVLGLLGATEGAAPASAAPAVDEGAGVTCSVCIRMGGDCCFVGNRPSCC